MNNKITKFIKEFPTPHEIKEYLDKYVIGQDEAKKVLSVAVYNHYKRVAYNLTNPDKNFDLPKSNVLMLGSTGSGKTLLCQVIAKMLQIPIYIQDCTKITASGYVGSDVEDCVAGLLRECDGDIQECEVGIIVLDEIDKNAIKNAGPSITRDVSGECVQQSLLKIVEGSRIGVQPNGGRKNPNNPLTYIDTNNILFIACGAFVGIEDIIKKRIGVNKSHIGFNAVNNNDDEINLCEELIADDLREFGMIPEFVGRFPVLTATHNLNVETLKRILIEPYDSIIKQYSELLSIDNTKLIFTDEALTKIANLAIENKTGARGLRNIVEKIMIDIMYDIPTQARKKLTKKEIKVNIDIDTVNKYFK